MEGEGLLERGFKPSGKPGRPEVVYRPTSKLLSAVGTRMNEAFVALEFANLKSACKYLNRDDCTYDRTVGKCRAAACPLLLK